MLKKIIILLVVWKTVLIILTYLATIILPFNNNFTPYRNFELYKSWMPYALVVMGNFDGIHYMQIAYRGYLSYEQPFFPLYPYLVKLLHNLTQLPYLLSSQLVSFISLTIAIIFIEKVMIVDRNRQLFSTVVLIILLFPTSFFYTASYNDSLFVLLATTTIYLARRNRWLLSSVIATLATATRLNGLALVIFIIIEYLSRTKLSVKNIIKHKII